MNPVPIEFHPLYQSFFFWGGGGGGTLHLHLLFHEIMYRL